MQALARRYYDELVKNVLPWWLENGPDLQYGGVFSCWNNLGTTLASTDKYMWSQGRWTWLMARLALIARDRDIGINPEYLSELAVDSGTFIRDFGIQEDGSVAYVVSRKGSLRSVPSGQANLKEGGPKDCFSDMFAALAFAGLAELTQESAWGHLAEKQLLSVTKRVEERDYRIEPVPVPKGHFALAVPMITIGVAEQVHRATGSVKSVEVLKNAAKTIDDLFRRGTDIAEVVPIGGSNDETLLTRHRNPGHVLELMWFIHHTRDLLPDDSSWTTDLVAEIVLNYCDLGWDQEYGGFFRFIDLYGGEPKGSNTGSSYESEIKPTWNAKLWWPHVEALYATALLSRATGNPELTMWHDRIQKYTFSTFPDSDGREWVQSRKRDGSPMEERIGLPVKDPFHIMRALMLLINLFDSKVI